MKRIPVMYAVLCLMIFSCKRDKVVFPNTKEVVDASFNLAGEFTTDIVPISQDDKKTNTYMPTNTQFVTALFYDANSILLGRIDQTSADPDYRHIKFKLPLRTLVHAFFIAVADNTFTISLKKGNANNLNTYPKGYPVLSYPNTVFPPNSSIYTLEKDYYVENPISEEVNLERAVSQLTVTITDPLPASASNNLLSISQPQYSTGLDLVNRIGDTPYISTTYGLPPLPSAQEVGKTGFTRSTFIWPAQNSFIKVFNGNFVSAEVPVPDGKFIANQQYIFKGILFLDVSQHFGFSINSDWNAPITVPISVPIDTN